MSIEKFDDEESFAFAFTESECKSLQVLLYYVSNSNMHLPGRVDIMDVRNILAAMQRRGE